MSKRKIALIWTYLTCLLVGGLLACCSREHEPVVVTPVQSVSPDFFALYALYKEAGTNHDIAVRDGEVTWYRGTTPGPNLLYFNLRGVFTGHDPEDRPWVTLTVKEEYRDRLEAWFDRHFEGYVGAFLDGDVVGRIEKVFASPRNALAVSGFASFEEAKALVDAIRGAPLP